MKRNHFFTFCLSMFVLLATFTNAYSMEYDEYVVKEGNCFWRIARSMKVDFKELKEVNRDRLRYAGNFDLIFPGQILLIPKRHVSVGKSIKKEVQVSSVKTKEAIAKKVSVTPARVENAIVKESKVTPVAVSKVTEKESKVSPVVVKKVAEKEDLVISAIVKEALAFKPVAVEERLPTADSSPVDSNPIFKKRTVVQYVHETLARLWKSKRALIITMFAWTVIISSALLLSNVFAGFVLWLRTLKIFSRRQLKMTKEKISKNIKRAFGAKETLQLETSPLAYVGFVAKTETDIGGYFILDASRDKFVTSIENLKKLAEIATQLYSENVIKRSISYAEPDQDVFKKCGVSFQGKPRPLCDDEISEFEENASLI